MRPYACVLLAAFLQLAAVQTARCAEIFGRVTDASGSALPGVLVTVTGASLAPPRHTLTGISGAYRLARIPAGVYHVVFHLDGFERAERADLPLSATFHARVDARLERAGQGVHASITKAPPLDMQATSVEDAAARERLAVLPLGRRDAILEFVPGTAAGWLREQRAAKVMSAGGQMRGAQAVGAARWFVDGGALGRGLEEPAIDFDLGSVEEIRVERGAVDVSVQSGAVQIVTRSGTNRFAGRVQFGMTDRLLQWDNLTTALREEGATLGSRVQRSSEVAVEAGGPLLARRAWAWASASRSHTDTGIVGFYEPACLQSDGSTVPDARNRLECLVPDESIVTSGSVKLQARLPGGGLSTLLWGRTSRARPYRGASALDRPESTTRQRSLGAARPLQVSHEWAASSRLALHAGYTFSDASFVLDFQEPRLSEVQRAYDRYTRVNWRSATASRQLRQSHDATISATYFATHGSGTHTATAGASFVSLTEAQLDRTGGGAVSVFDSRTGPQLPWQARIVRDGQTNHRSSAWSAVAQDSYVRGRLTLNVGARVESQDDRALQAAIPANRILPELLPAVRFPGADSGVVYNDISPRAGVAWDIGGRGDSLLKIGFARYPATGNATSALLQPTGQTRLVYWWSDANGDRLVEAAELDLRRGMAATPTSNYDAGDPASPTSPAAVDRRLRNVRTEEASVRLERQVGRRAAVRVSYVARRTSSLQRSYPIESDGSPVSSTTFKPVQWLPSNCPAGARCPSVVYFEREAPMPARTVLRNDGRYEWRQRADLALHKRLADGWMLDAALTWNRSVARFPRPTRDYTDPTNVSLRDGTEYSSPEPRWVAKVSGSLRLPAGFSTAFFLAGQQGLPLDRVVASPNRGALGSTHVSIGRFGVERYPPWWRLDARLDWRIKIRRVTLAPTLNVFNALNSNVVLARNRVQNSRSANQVLDIMAPRVMRLDVSLAW